MDHTFEYFLTWTEGVVGQLHLAFAMIALLAGLLVIVLRKGTRRHMVLGYVYLSAMLILNTTALMKYDLTGASNMFHYFAIGSLLTIIVGYTAILIYKRRRRVVAARTHGEVMIWSYFGLVMALIAEVVTRGFPFMLHGDGGWMRFTSALIAFMLIAAFFTYRHIQLELSKVFARPKQ